jgi:CBS domain-containing protein
MLTSPIRSIMDSGKLVTASPATTVSDAARLMEKGKVGAILVVDNDRLVGIFTERDALFRVVARDRDPQATRLAEVMTPAPVTVSPDETFGYALLVMHDNGFRHTPVVENGRPVAMLSARHALDPDLEEFTAEAERRRSIRRRAR